MIHDKKDFVLQNNNSYVIFQYDCKYEHLSTKKQEYLDYYLDIFFYLRIVTMAENLPSMSYSLPLHNDTNDDWCM